MLIHRLYRKRIEESQSTAQTKLSAAIKITIAGMYTTKIKKKYKIFYN